MASVVLPGISARCLHIFPQANMECRADMPGNLAAAMFKIFYYMFTQGSLRCGRAIDVIYDAVGAHEGRYGFT